MAARLWKGGPRSSGLQAEAGVGAITSKKADAAVCVCLPPNWCKGVRLLLCIVADAGAA